MYDLCIVCQQFQIHTPKRQSIQKTHQRFVN